MEIKLRSTLYNMMQYHATWWANEFNMLHSTLLNGVESQCCIRLARALAAMRGRDAECVQAWVENI